MPSLSSIVGFSDLEKNFNITVRTGPLILSHIFLLSLLSMVPSVWPVFGFIFSTRDLRRNLCIWWHVGTTSDDVIYTSKFPSCQVAIYCAVHDSTSQTIFFFPLIFWFWKINYLFLPSPFFKSMSTRYSFLPSTLPICITITKWSIPLGDF